MRQLQRDCKRVATMCPVSRGVSRILKVLNVVRGSSVSRHRNSLRLARRRNIARSPGFHPDCPCTQLRSSAMVQPPFRNSISSRCVWSERRHEPRNVPPQRGVIHNAFLCKLQCVDFRLVHFHFSNSAAIALVVSFLRVRKCGYEPPRRFHAVLDSYRLKSGLGKEPRACATGRCAGVSHSDTQNVQGGTARACKSRAIDGRRRCGRA